MDETRRVLVLPDTHIPNHDRKSLNAVFNYAGSQEWDEVIHLGDLMDLDLISSYNKGQLRKVEGQRLMRDFAAGNEFLDELEAATPDAKKVIIEGNHDERMERYLNVNPELEGVLEVKNQLRLDERGIRWVRFASKGEMYKIGKATFIHGIYVGPHHAAKHVEAYEKNIFYGHCISYDTEVLTRRGWVSPISLLENDEVVSLNPDGVSSSYQPINKFVVNKTDKFVMIEGRAISLMVTPEHDLLLQPGEERPWEKVSAENALSQSHMRFKNSAPMYQPGVDLTYDEIRLAVWIAADGTLENTRNAVRWHLKKERKIVALTRLLERLGIDFTKSISKTGSTKIYVNLKLHPKVRNLFTWGEKILPRVFTTCSPEQIRVIHDEYMITDGCWTSRNGRNNLGQISTAKEDEANLIHQILILGGYRANMTRRPSGWIISTNTNSISTLQSGNTVEVVRSKENVWCIETPLGNFMVRRNGKTCFIGNCHDFQSHSKRSIGDNDVKIGQSLGCLCKYKPYYLKGWPDKWQQGFAVFHFLPNGYFNYYPVSIFNNKFVSPEGHVWK